MSTNEIAKYAEKVNVKFPQIPAVEIVQIWFEQWNIPFSISEKSNVTETIMEFLNTT
jgi:hypothetical protein